MPRTFSSQAPLKPPLRLWRGVRVLCVMGAIVISVSLWEIFNSNIFDGWTELPLQLIRGALPLGLIYLISTGKVWARYALALYCAYLLYCNLPYLSDLPAMLRKSHFGNFGQVLLLFGGYLLVGFLSLFSSAITGLQNYRIDQREREEMSGSRQ